MGHLTTGIISRVWFIAETNYGGGVAGIKYAKTPAPAVDSLASVNVMSSTGNYKAKKFKRKRWTAPGVALGKGVLFTKNVEFPEVEFTYALQTLADPFFVASKGGTKGTTGTSFMLQVSVPDETEAATIKYYNLFGCQITSYNVKGGFDTDDPPLVTVKFICFDMVLSANAGADLAQTGVWPTGVINEWDDMAVDLDGDTIDQLKSIDLNIINKYNEIKVGGSGTFTKIDSVLVDKTIEYKIEFFKDIAELLIDTFTEAINLFIATWTDGTNTLSVTNCYSDEDNYMQIENTEAKAMEYSITVKSGDSVFT